MKLIKPKDHHNYVAFFLTLACNLQCHYCINLHDGGTRYKLAKRRNLSVDEWIQAANRLTLRDDLPLTLQGGEPTLFKGFYRFVNEVKEEIKMDLLTNLVFDVDEFIRNISVDRFRRSAPYASIRVSYHPGQNDIEDLIEKTIKMQDSGFRVGIYGILSPDSETEKIVLKAKEKCLKIGLDFRTKEFLGKYNGRLYGNYEHKGAVCGGLLKSCECRTTELIVDPGGYIYRCHSDLFKGRTPIAHILDEEFTEEEIEKYRKCNFYGDCNPCDVKVKTNRFQTYGHTSVSIRSVNDEIYV